jgi:hypothetical protein
MQAERRVVVVAVVVVVVLWHPGQEQADKCPAAALMAAVAKAAAA